MTKLYLNAPFQTTYAIETNANCFANLLIKKYGQYITESDKKADFFISAIETNEEFVVATAIEHVQTNMPLLKIDEIIFHNTQYDEKILALHGSAVEWNGEVSLFLAATTSGKTTLASYLVSRGFGFLTDDCILVDRTSFLVYPHTMPIHLRDGGLAVLQKYHAVPENIELLESPEFRRFLYTPQNCVKTALPLKQIFFINRTEERNEVKVMSTTSRLTSLMKAPITDYPVTSDYIKFLSALAKIPCYQLFYCDMDYVAEVLQNDN